MKIVGIFLLLLVGRNVTSRRHSKVSSSGESIENLLYYQDCKHSTTVPTTTAKPIKLKEELPRPSCPFPKMCCAMSCNNEPCISEQLNGFSNQMHPNLEPARMQNQRQPFRQPMLRARKKKLKPPMIPIGQGGRRDFGFTKDNIKTLISQDGDIRKILKELVRVTMQKVDLQEMINSRRAMVQENAKTTSKPVSVEYEDEDL